MKTLSDLLAQLITQCIKLFFPFSSEIVLPVFCWRKKEREDERKREVHLHTEEVRDLEPGGFELGAEISAILRDASVVFDPAKMHHHEGKFLSSMKRKVYRVQTLIIWWNIRIAIVAFKDL
ncbi:hypothetical protein Tco_0750976 [Tanacetum coccineum]|uniref:Uncharacterized protein n=1 Tax=Tanacetum coccineum TaxID=301880 RepID=A0ABQ4Z2Z6_9ASTR